MPSVLLECGFISNADDLAYLRTNQGIDSIAQAIFNGFKKFKENYESTSVHVVPATPVSSDENKEAKASSIRYGIQVFASTSPSKSVKGNFKKEVIKAGRYYKFIVCVGDDLAAVKKEWKKVKKYYPDSFLVKINGDKVTICKK